MSVIQKGFKMKDIVKKFQTVRLAFHAHEMFARDSCFKLWRHFTRQRLRNHHTAKMKGLRYRWKRWKMFLKNYRKRDLEEFADSLDAKIAKLNELNMLMATTARVQDAMGMNTSIPAADMMINDDIAAVGGGMVKGAGVRVAMRLMNNSSSSTKSSSSTTTTSSTHGTTNNSRTSSISANNRNSNSNPSSVGSFTVPRQSTVGTGSLLMQSLSAKAGEINGGSFSAGSSSGGGAPSLIPPPISTKFNTMNSFGANYEDHFKIQKKHVADMEIVMKKNLGVLARQRLFKTLSLVSVLDYRLHFSFEHFLSPYCRLIVASRSKFYHSK